MTITTPKIGFLTLTAANTSKVGSGAGTLFSAGTSGSRLDRIAFRSKGANVASVARIFIHDGTNSHLVDEIDLPATTVTELAAKPLEDYAQPIELPNGYSIQVTLGTAVSDGWEVTAFGGDA